MKLVLLSTLLILASCKTVLQEDPLAAKTIVEVDRTTEIIQGLQGTYHDCKPSTEYPGYFINFDVAVNGDVLTFSRGLSGSATCASVYYMFDYEYEIDRASYAISGNVQDINLDLKVVDFKTTFFHWGYLSSNYCGFTDWAVSVPKSLAGVTCPGLMTDYDALFSSFRAPGASEYWKVTLKTNSLVVPYGFVQGGDSASSRMVDEEKDIPKI